MVVPGLAGTVLLAFSKDLFEELGPTSPIPNTETADIYISVLTVNIYLDPDRTQCQ